MKSAYKITIFFIIFASLMFAQKSNTIKVGIYENYPKVYITKSGKAAGIFPEILELIAAKENWKLEFVEGSWNECLQRLENAEINLMVDVAYSEERQTRFDFCDEPVMFSWGCVYTRPGLQINSILDLTNKKIAVMHNSILTNGRDGIYNLVKRYGVNCNFVEVDNYYQVFKLIDKKMVDAGITNRHFGAAFQNEYNVAKSNFIFFPTQLSFAFTKNSSFTEKLSQKIDEHLIALKKDMNSEYYDILTDYGLYPKKDIPTWLFTIIIVLAILIFIFFVVYLILKWQIQKQTETLQKTNLQLRDQNQLHQNTLKELERSREIYRNFVESIPGMAYMYDVNEQGERIPIIRTSRNQEFLGEKVGIAIEENYNTFFDFMVEEDKKRIQKISSEIEKKNNDFDFEYRIKLSENKVKWFRSIGRVRRLKNGFIRWQGVILDIDDRKQIEDALERSLNQWQSTFDAAVDAFLILDRNQRILQANNSATRIFKKTKQELLNNLCYEIIHNENKTIDNCPILRMRKSLKREEIEFNVENDFWLQITVDPIFDDEDNLIGAVHISRDISERKQMDKELAQHREHLEKLIESRTKDLKQKTKELEEANRELLEADKLKSIFLASMSHELRTPLNSIIGFTGILLMGMVGDLTDEQKKQLQIVKKSASHLLELINDILDISKIEANKVEVDIEQISVNELVNEVMLYIKPKTDEKGIDIICDLPEDLIMFTDRRRVKQILLNLMSNAAKFTEKGKIIIGVKSSDGNVEFRVEDEGCGIKDEDMKKLFEPFQQIDSTLTKKHEGTGLGLHLTEKLTYLLQGKISVESKFGKGTTFKIYLPQNHQKKIEGEVLHE